MNEQLQKSTDEDDSLIDPEIEENISLFEGKFDSIVISPHNNGSYQCGLYDSEVMWEHYSFIVTKEKLRELIRVYPDYFLRNIDPEIINMIEEAKEITAITYKSGSDGKLRCTIQNRNLLFHFRQFTISEYERIILETQFESIPFLTEFEYILYLIKNSKIKMIKAVPYPHGGKVPIVPFDELGRGFGQFEITQEEFRSLKDQYEENGVEFDLVNNSSIDGGEKGDENKRRYGGKAKSSRNKPRKVLLYKHQKELGRIGFNEVSIHKIGKKLQECATTLSDDEIPEGMTKDDLILALRTSFSTTIDELIRTLIKK